MAIGANAQKPQGIKLRSRGSSILPGRLKGGLFTSPAVYAGVKKAALMALTSTSNAPNEEELVIIEL